MAYVDLGKVKILWRGTWSAANSYEANDVVSLNGSLWICTQTYTNVSNNRRAPGLRDRTTAYGVQFDADKTPKDVFQLQKIGGKFYIEGRRNPGYTGTGSAITLYRGQTYRFMTYHSTMTGVNFRFATATDGTTYSTGVTVVGTPGFSGSYVQITVDQAAPNTLYFKQDTVSGVADTSFFTIADSWEGYNYWELLSEGFTWKGAWSAATQYYRGDVVEQGGRSWIAKADSLGRIPDIGMQVNLGTTVTSATSSSQWPNTRGTWEPFSETSIPRTQTTGVLPGHGPIDWPYLHGYQNSVNYRGFVWATKSGRVYNSYMTSTGYSTGGVSGTAEGAYNSFPQETSFWHVDWFRSRDNLPRYTFTKSASATSAGDTFDYIQRRTGIAGLDYYGRTDKVTPHGQQPRCIQIESSYTKHYFLFDDGSIHSSGSNSVGQSGTGFASTGANPMRVMIAQNTRFKKVVTGNNGGAASNQHHVMALDEDGNVWTWGYNAQGQLGTGDAGNRYVPYKIPKEYFGNQRVIDIYIGGQDTGSSYARTEQSQLYSWGANNVGQLGLGDTTSRWRPNLIAAFDPAANNGIIKAQATGESTAASFYVLDGNGYMWHAGYNAHGQGIDNTTTQHNSLVRSTQSPTAGATVNFWAFTNATSYTGVWMRTSNGNTYFCGYNSGGQFHAGTGDNVNKQIPTLVYNVTNCREMWCVTDYAASGTDVRHRTMWLTENGQMWAAGYINFRWQSNILAASATGTIEDGTNTRPYRVAIPSGSKVQSMWMSSADEGSNVFGPFVFAATDNGQLWFAGPSNPANGYAWVGGQRYIIGSGQNWMPLTKGR